MTEFKHCPFCGAKLEKYDPWSYKHPDNDCYLIKMTEILPFLVDGTDIKEWNRRTAE